MSVLSSLRRIFIFGGIHMVSYHEHKLFRPVMKQLRLVAVTYYYVASALASIGCLSLVRDSEYTE